MMNTVIEILEKHKDNYARIVTFNEANDKLVKLDLSSANNQLGEETVNDTRLFTKYINDHLSQQGARYAIGGYNEVRPMYARSHVFNAEGEPRRLHLGTDIWGKQGTSVSSPLDGIVHSYANNDGFGNYGGTIIISHMLDGVTFHILYGHLSLSSIRNLHAGQHIEKGEIFAEFGIQSENGQWPPHLHFQIIEDLEGNEGDYPGVCKESEKDKWLRNCPDPDIILGLNKFIS